MQQSATRAKKYADCIQARLEHIASFYTPERHDRQLKILAQTSMILDELKKALDIVYEMI